MKRLSLAATLSLLALLGTAHARDSAPISKTRVLALMTRSQLDRLEPSVDPDTPALRYGMIGGRWSARAGASLLLVGFESPAIRAGLLLAGLIELTNFSTEYPVPWQTYRANIGFDIYVDSPRLDAALPRGGRLFTTIGFFHESDHIADHINFQNRFASGQLFEDPEFSSFEYFKWTAGYQQRLGRLTLQALVGLRAFTPPVVRRSVRELRAAFLLEAQAALRLSETFFARFALYFEHLANDFDATRAQIRGGARGEPLPSARLLMSTRGRHSLTGRRHHREPT